MTGGYLELLLLPFLFFLVIHETLAIRSPNRKTKDHKLIRGSLVCLIGSTGIAVGILDGWLIIPFGAAFLWHGVYGLRVALAMREKQDSSPEEE